MVKIRAALTAAVDAEQIAVSPCRGIKLPAKQRSEIRFLDADELARLALETPPEYQAMIYLAGVLGLRWSEVAGLRVGRVDFLRRTSRSSRPAQRSKYGSSSPT